MAWTRSRGRPRPRPRRWLLQAVGWLAPLMALRVAAAAAAAGPALLPFPPPFHDPVVPVVGRFHTLPSLACDTRPPVTGGRRGYYYQEAAGAAPVWVPGAPGVCASPVEDPVQQALYANASNGDPYYHRRSRTPAARAAAHTRLRDMRSRPPSRGGVVDDVVHTPLGGDADPRSGLHYEGMVERLLTLHRNSFYGGVLRFTGDWDVLAVSRVTAGVCLTEDCADMSALAIAEHSALDINGSRLPVLTFPLVNATDDDARRTVAITDDGLLSLGRAVLADPRWLLRTAPWRATVKAHVGLQVKGSARRREDEDSAFFGNYNRWSIEDRVESWAGSPAAGASTGSSKWLQAVAFVFCEPPAASFVRSAGWLCAGMGAAAVKNAPLRARINGRGQVPRERPITAAGRQARWHVYANASAATLPLCVPDGSLDRITPKGRSAFVGLPPWLWGVGSREVNPASAAEAALAAATRACVVEPPLDGVDATPAAVVARMTERVHQSGDARTRSFDSLMAALESHSQAYDRTVFAAEPPEPPVTNSELTLAIIVVAPELVALLVLLVSTAEWRRRELLVLLFVFLAGLVSLAAAVQLVVREVTGAAWRGASLRDELSLELLGPADTVRTLDRNLRSHLLFRNYALIMVARLGYRVPLVAIVGGAVTIVYVVASVGVGYFVWRLWRRGPSVPPAGGGAGGGGGAALGADGEAGGPSADGPVEGGPAWKAPPAVVTDVRPAVSAAKRRALAKAGDDPAGWAV